MKLITKNHTYSFHLRSLTGSAAVFCTAISLVFLLSCNNSSNIPPHQEIVNTPQQMTAKIPDVIKKIVNHFDDNLGKIDSISILQPATLQYLYDKTDHEAKWSREERWVPIADSVMNFISNTRLYGLFPEDYHFKNVSQLKERFAQDTNARKDAVLWSKADLLLTDALVQIIKDVKLGRLQKDSITLRSDSALTNEFYEQQLQKIAQSNSISAVIDSLEPTIKAYQELKAGIKQFLDTAEFKDYTYVPYPVYDSIGFKKSLPKRLFEEGLLDSSYSLMDSVEIAKGIKKYQQQKKLKADGIAGSETIRSLNLTDKDKFFRIALSLDKYKMLPAKMPEKYLWVNLAGYYLQLWESDSLRIFSKVVVGKPLTRTPELSSSISEMITYPQWSVPQSIIVKEFLPELKKDPGYLEKKGFSLLDTENQEVDPYFVDWSKYKKGIPYKIIQGSGDDNALGIMKFNFPNKYAVYLHDTNQRYLFSQSSRALSHGCVRVQEWEKLSNFILQNDSTYIDSLGRGSFTKTDSVVQWLARKEKHYIPVKKKIPLFIRYFTCEGRNGKIIFYDDMYNEDHRLRERYFAGK
ncbi:MAG TPA: L,D-transpeptidase family protein [Chitinophagaceae bacterium]|jgi:murein L,D-transpeptidase YcbB/YkuD|nr:L,D-transpeptidase family protein [Chitinophagaceae bacterium]